MSSFDLELAGRKRSHLPQRSYICEVPTDLVLGNERKGQLTASSTCTLYLYLYLYTLLREGDGICQYKWIYIKVRRTRKKWIRDAFALVHTDSHHHAEVQLIMRGGQQFRSGFWAPYIIARLNTQRKKKELNGMVALFCLECISCLFINSQSIRHFLTCYDFIRHS